MKKAVILAALLASMGAANAFASSVTLTFTGLQDGESINNFYNGGTGGNGSSGGTNYGVSFSSDSLAVIAQSAGGTGFISGMPAPATTTAAFFLTGAGDTMDVAAGFTTGFSFYYAAAILPGSISVYSGLNGTGTLLDTLSLAVNGEHCDASGEPFDCWTNTGVSFAGTAESVIFGGSANEIAFADITLGAASVPSVTPEPGSLILLGTGALGMAGAIRRKLKV